MRDIEMIEHDKENIAPAVTGRLFSSCSSITAKIGEYFPVYFNRKRRRDSSDDNDEEQITEHYKEKRQKRLLKFQQKLVMTSGRATTKQADGAEEQSCEACI